MPRPQPPAAVEGDRDQEDPEPAPAIRAQQYRDGDPDREGEAELDHPDREDEQDAGEDVAAAVAPPQHQDRAEAQRQGEGRVHVEGPQQRLPGKAEEEQGDARHQRRNRPDPAPGELEEEADAEHHAGDVDGTEDGVVAAGDVEQESVEQLAGNLQVAVARRQEVFEPVGHGDFAAMRHVVRVVEEVVGGEAEVAAGDHQPGRRDAHRRRQRQPGETGRAGGGVHRGPRRSSGTRQIASATIEPSIFELPACRSRKTIGTSTTLNPARIAR